jgi:hypothetical protein
MHLVYSLYIASYEADAKSIENLGIACQHIVFQPMGDCYWLWNCKNVPNSLPAYIKELQLDPMNQIGWGLTQEEAEMIRDYKDL